MSENENTQKGNFEVKGYSAKQSVNVRNEQPGMKGYNPQMSIQQRNDTPIKEGYNAQQMVQTVNNQSAPQPAQQSKSAKTSEGQK